MRLFSNASSTASSKFRKRVSAEPFADIAKSVERVTPIIKDFSNNTTFLLSVDAKNFAKLWLVFNFDSTMTLKGTSREYTKGVDFAMPCCEFEKDG